MSDIDYEVEYNNRARVPEHPEIFARWAEEGAAYRTEAGSEGRAEIGIKYGPSPRQTIDLFWGRGGGSRAPLALFIHGGYWRSLEPSSFSQMARGLNAHGVTVAVSGYDLCPQVSIGDIVTQTQSACIYLWRRIGRRIMVSGHSAGGHLAACMVATDWKAVERDVPADLVPMGYAISGLYDLAPLLHLATNADFKLDEEEARRILAAVLAGRGRSRAGGGGRRAGVLGIPAPEQDHRRWLARPRRTDPLRGDRTDQPFHGLRPHDRSRQQHGRPPDRARGAHASDRPISPPTRATLS